MEKMGRSLGKSGITVSAMGLGCWAIGGPFRRGDAQVGWGEVDDAQSVAAIHRALDLGITFFDTADVYGAGHSERVLARALGTRRKDVVIATKFGNLFDEESRTITGEDGSPDHVHAACDASLKRLGTDYIDLYQFHLNGYDIQRAVDVRDALDDLVRAGKIRAYAWSTGDPERAGVFADGGRCAAVQHQMNVFDDAPEMIRLCEMRNLASINRGPLAMGLLTGKYSRKAEIPEDDLRGRKSPAWMTYFHEGMPNAELLGKLEQIRTLLTADGRTLAQGALGWLWARSSKTIPIPGFKTAAQVEENVGAFRCGPLAVDLFEEIERLMERR
ncbi:MAG TPA: aldo/keto reductase [Spirochaetia bacterium]|nr:aldo/keto reductase [Spirochaetia bacterium]